MSNFKFQGGLAPPATPSDALDTNYIVTALQQRMEIQKAKHFVQLIYSTEFPFCFTKKSVHSLPLWCTQKIFMGGVHSAA